jgi:DNA mismatch repair protein MutS
MTDKQAKTFTKLWHELKAKHPDAILLFRCGDFYEAYDVDAQACAKILGIELNNCDAGCVMAGFPHYALDTYLPKLIRAKKRVAICDQLVDPKVVNKQESINPKNESVMANETLKAADLIGKRVNLNGGNYYVVTNVDGDMLQTEFHRGDSAPMAIPMKWEAMKKFFDTGVAHLADEEPAKATATDDIPEVEDIQPEAPKAKPEEPKAEKPKAAPKPKAEKPKAEPKTEAPKAASKREESVAGTSSTEREQTSHASGKAEEPKRYTIVDYTTSKGKAGKKIYGLSDTEPAYTMAATIHASGSYEKDANGNKKYYLCFGPKYSAQAIGICAALNAGKPIANLQAIANGPAENKMYTKAEVIDLMRRAIAGDKEAIAFMNAA